MFVSTLIDSSESVMYVTSEIIEKHIDEIKELYSCDVPVTHIARDFKIPRSSLYGYMSKHPEIFPRRQFRRRISKKESTELYSEWLNGENLCTIAKNHGISSTTVFRHVMKNNSRKNYSS